MATNWPNGNADNSLNLIQLCVNIDKTLAHTRAVAAGEYLSKAATDPRFMGVGGVYTLALPTLTDGQAGMFRLTAAGRLMVDTEMSLDGAEIFVNNIKVGSTDGAALDAGLRVSSTWRAQELMWGTSTTDAEKAGHVDQESVNAIVFRPLMVGGSDIVGVPHVFRTTPLGAMIVAPVVVGPTTILSSVATAAADYNSTKVDTRECGSGQCFSLDASNVVLGGGSVTVVFEWSMDNTNFAPFTGGTIAVGGNTVDLYQFDFKAPYIRATETIAGGGITSATIVIKHFANGA